MAHRKKPSDILPRLLEWETIYREWMVQYDALRALTLCQADAPLPLASGRMWDAYTASVAREVCDSSEWLDWYCWENEMGGKGLAVTSTSGKKIKVRTVQQLARVICY